MNRSLSILTLVALSVGLPGCYSESKADETAKVENTKSEPGAAKASEAKAPEAKAPANVPAKAETMPTWIVYTLPG